MNACKPLCGHWELSWPGPLQEPQCSEPLSYHASQPTPCTYTLWKGTVKPDRCLQHQRSGGRERQALGVHRLVSLDLVKSRPMRETLFEQEVLHQRMDIQGTYGGSYTYVRPSLNKQDCRKWVFCYINIRKRYLQCSLVYWGHRNFYCAKNSRYKHPSAGEAEWIKAKKYKRNMMTSK